MLVLTLGAVVTGLWGVSGVRRWCREGSESWHCEEAGREECGRIRASDGGAWNGCLPPHLLLHPSGARICRTLHHWLALEPRILDLIPQWHGPSALHTPHSRFTVRRQPDGRVRNRSCPLSAQSAISGAAARLVSCANLPAQAHCCVSWTPGEGPWAGRQMGLGCESCAVGEGNLDFVLWRGGGGGQLLPPLWNDTNELCVWPSLTACWEDQVVKDCPSEKGCCMTRNARPVGCGVCPPNQGCLNNGTNQVCSCIGYLCNGPLPSKSRSRGRFLPPPDSHDWPRYDQSHGHHPHSQRLLAQSRSGKGGSAPSARHHRINVSGVGDLESLIRHLSGAAGDIVRNTEQRVPHRLAANEQSTAIHATTINRALILTALFTTATLSFPLIAP